MWRYTKYEGSYSSIQNGQISIHAMRLDRRETHMTKIDGDDAELPHFFDKEFPLSETCLKHMDLYSVSRMTHPNLDTE